MLRRLFLIAGLVPLTPLWTQAQADPASSAGSLATLRGRSRPLLIFYPQSGRPAAPALEKQRALFRGHEEELQERDVEVLYIPANHGMGPSPTKCEIWREQFGVDERSFTVVLLGKDGGEKFRSHEPVTIEKLDALIDAMPMRQQEVRDGRHTE